MILEIILSILGILIITGYVILKIKLSKHIDKIDVSANMPLCENMCRRAFTNGYYLGVIKSQLPRKNGTSLIEFYPIDVEQGESVPRPNVQSIIVKNEFIKRFPRGELSSYREVVKLIGRNPADMPERMRKTEEGDWMAKEGQKAWILSTFGKAISAGDEAIAESMKEYARGNIAKNTLAEIKEVNKKSREMAWRSGDIPLSKDKDQ